jgi:hypothetical protein
MAHVCGVHSGHVRSKIFGRSGCRKEPKKKKKQQKNTKQKKGVAPPGRVIAQEKQQK